LCFQCAECVRCVCHQRRECPPREEQAGTAADASDHETFGEHLSHDAAAAGANRRADCEFAAARRQSCDQQVRHGDAAFASRPAVWTASRAGRFASDRDTSRDGELCKVGQVNAVSWSEPPNWFSPGFERLWPDAVRFRSIASGQILIRDVYQPQNCQRATNSLRGQAPFAYNSAPYATEQTA